MCNKPKYEPDFTRIIPGLGAPILIIIILIGIIMALLSCRQLERPEKPFIIYSKSIYKMDTTIIRYSAYDAGGRYIHFDGRVNDYQIGDTIP